MKYTNVFRIVIYVFFSFSSLVFGSGEPVGKQLIAAEDVSMQNLQQNVKEVFIESMKQHEDLKDYMMFKLRNGYVFREPKDECQNKIVEFKQNYIEGQDSLFLTKVLYGNLLKILITPAQVVELNNLLLSEHVQGQDNELTELDEAFQKMVQKQREIKQQRIEEWECWVAELVKAKDGGIGYRVTLFDENASQVQYNGGKLIINKKFPDLCLLTVDKEISDLATNLLLSQQNIADIEARNKLPFILQIDYEDEKLIVNIAEIEINTVKDETGHKITPQIISQRWYTSHFFILPTFAIVCLVTGITLLHRRGV